MNKGNSFPYQESSGISQTHLSLSCFPSRSGRCSETVCQGQKTDNFHPVASRGPHTRNITSDYLHRRDVGRAHSVVLHRQNDDSKRRAVPKLLARPERWSFHWFLQCFNCAPSPGRAARRILSPENRERGEKICNEVKREPISPCFSRAPSKTHNFRLTHSRNSSSRLAFWDERFPSSPPWIFICESMPLLGRKLSIPRLLPLPHKQKDSQHLVRSDGKYEKSSATWIVDSRGFFSAVGAEENKSRKDVLMTGCGGVIIVVNQSGCFAF